MPFCCMDKVKKRHSQMTNTAKRQCSSGIYDNEKLDKRTKVEDEPSQGTNQLFDKYSCPQPGAPDSEHEIRLEIEEWLHTLHTSVMGRCVRRVVTFSSGGCNITEEAI